MLCSVFLTSSYLYCSLITRPFSNSLFCMFKFSLLNLSASSDDVFITSASLLLSSSQSLRSLPTSYFRWVSECTKESFSWRRDSYLP